MLVALKVLHLIVALAVIAGYYSSPERVQDFRAQLMVVQLRSLERKRV